MGKSLKNPKSMNIVRMVVLIVAVVLMCCFFVGMYAQSDVTPGTIKLGAKYTLVVLSDSMSPTIDAGDLITVHKVVHSEIEVGDIICFYSEDVDTYGWKITHKVNDKTLIDGQYHYQTISAQGEIDRTLVKDSRVIGKVVNVVPNIGKLVLFMQGTQGYIFFILIPLSVLIISQMIFVIVKFKKFNASNKIRQQELLVQNNQLQQEMEELRKIIEQGKSDSQSNNVNELEDTK